MYIGTCLDVIGAPKGGEIINYQHYYPSSIIIIHIIVGCAAAVFGGHYATINFT